MPELNVAAPSNVSGGEHGNSPREVQRHAQVTPVEAIDQHAAEKGHEQPGKSHHDVLQAHLHGGVRCGHDVPAHGYEIHAATEERDKHGREEITEAALRPDEIPVDACCYRACHRTSSLLSCGRRYRTIAEFGY